jgi:hypothetical protein
MSWNKVSWKISRLVVLLIGICVLAEIARQIFDFSRSVGQPVYSSVVFAASTLVLALPLYLVWKAIFTNDPYSK